MSGLRVFWALVLVAPERIGILLVDDLIATGGTAEAAARLLQLAGGHVVAAAFVIELPDLGGRARLDRLGMDVFSMLEFPGH